MGRPKGEKYQRIIALRVEDDLAADLERMAVAEERPLGVMARILVKEAIAAREGKKAKKKPAGGSP